MADDKAEEKKKVLNDYESFKINPSFEKKLPGIRIGVIELEGSVLRLADENSGEVVKQYHLLSEGKKWVIDKLPFVKVFEGAWERLPELTIPSMKLLVYIFRIIKPDTDSFILDMDDVYKKCGYKNQTSVYPAIIGLLENGFIYRRVGQHEYFINVNMFFNGKRVKLPPLADLQKRIDEAQNKKQ